MQNETEQYVAPTYSAIYKYAPISAQKVRVFANLIRGKYADEAMTLLSCYPNRGARMLEHTLKSAMANAADRNSANQDLRIVDVRVDGGPMRRRWKAGSRGASRIIKIRSSHISVVLE
ncbi:MAG: 50S ribosomal protein L22 [Planctomycetia bacterium]|nr:50S ribosomal protein L22 [Planctomycetia bacterium]